MEKRSLALIFLALLIIFTGIGVYLSFQRVGLVAPAAEKNFSEKTAPVSASKPPLPTTTSPPLQPQLPTFEQVFSENHSWTGRLPKEKVRTLVTAGDAMLGRSVNFQAVKSNNFTRLFETTASVLQTADLAFINLESPLAENCPSTNSGMIFCGDQRHMEGLKLAGIDIANLANNHAGDYLLDGLTSTLFLLNQADISATGVSGSVLRDLRGARFAFLGYNDIGPHKVDIAKAGHEIISQEVAESKNMADIVVVAFHWGDEYTGQPTLRQQRLAKLAIDAGADLIIGHHPHWIQPIEIYRDRYIFYSLGNFIFDQTWSPATQEGLVSYFTFYDNRLVDIELMPVQIKENGQPNFIVDERKKIILKQIQEASLSLITARQ